MSSFPVLDVFVKVAGHLARKGYLEIIGKPIKTIKQLTDIKPVVPPEGNIILGSIIYIDNYGMWLQISPKIYLKKLASQEILSFLRTLKFRKIVNHYIKPLLFITCQ